MVGLTREFQNMDTNQNDKMEQFDEKKVCKEENSSEESCSDLINMDSLSLAAGNDDKNMDTNQNDKMEQFDEKKVCKEENSSEESCSDLINMDSLSLAAGNDDKNMDTNQNDKMEQFDEKKVCKEENSSEESCSDLINMDSLSLAAGNDDKNMDTNQNDKMEQFDEKKVCKEENSSEESCSDLINMDSLSFAAGNDDKPARCQVSPVVACEKFRKLTLNHTTKKKEEIKDIANDKILPLLPAKTLIRFRSVSKEWDYWIKSPLLALHQSYSFSKLSGFFCQYDDWKHTFVTLDHPAYGVPTESLAFLPEFVNIRSSSGGLLLCQGRDGNNSYYICNPVTKEWRKLPKPECHHGSDTAILLVFEPSLLNMNANYHLICAVRLIDQPVVCFEVYSSATQSWRQSSAYCLEFDSPNFTGNGFYMKGVAYWETSTKKVLAFDFMNDSYEIMRLPFGSPLGGVLTQMHEELCYIGISRNWGNEYRINIYGGMDLKLKRTVVVNIVQVSGEMDSSLRRTVDEKIGLVSDDIKGYRVLSCDNGGIVTILVEDSIYSCSLSDQNVELVSSEGVDCCWGADRYLPYVNSLVCVT